MESETKMYIAGMGMTTPLGSSAEMTEVAVNAGISAYKLSGYENQQGQPISMTRVPDELLSSLQVDIDIGTYYREQYDRIIKLAIFALQDTLSGLQCDHAKIKQALPLILATSEPDSQSKPIDIGLLINQVNRLSEVQLDAQRVHSVPQGRAAGIGALALAYRYLDELKYDYVLVGGSDSYWNIDQINQLDIEQRLLSKNNTNGFAPGEAAGFILLTRHANKALMFNGHIIKLHPPGVSEEVGHMYSQLCYKGQGLDLAFKQALSFHASSPVSTIYSSMNGEHFWAKEYSVATIRNKKKFKDEYLTEHPADCYGDLGAATGSILIALSAMRLFKQAQPDAHLVYSSSDGASRAAVCVEKIAL